MVGLVLQVTRARSRPNDDLDGVGWSLISIAGLKLEMCVFAWVIGTTWTGAMTASQQLAATLRKQTRENEHQLTSTDRDHIVDTFRKTR